MINPNQLKGTGVALITPFKSDKTIDLEALEKLINYVILNQVDFLVALGTTSEAATLSDKEKHQVVRHIIKINAGRLPVVIGIGGNNTAQVVDTINHTDFDGIDGILSVAPYYNKPNQEGLYQHFKAISEVAPVPIILYNVPGRTASNISAETTLKLANEYKNIIAIKEASGDFEQIMDILKYRPDGFKVLSGDDATTLPLISLGADGVISVIANGFPFEYSQMLREAHNNAYHEARKLHYKMTDIIKNLFKEGNPAGIKAILHARGIIQNTLRLPLVNVTETLYEKLKKQLSDFE